MIQGIKLRGSSLLNDKHGDHRSTIYTKQHQGRFSITHIGLIKAIMNSTERVEKIYNYVRHIFVYQTSLVIAKS